MMLKHHIKVSIRHIVKQGLYSILNIAGLSIGFTLSLLVLLLVRHELNYDKSFSNHLSIYRYVTKGILSSNFINSATSPMPLGDFLKQYDEVKEVVRFVPGASNVISVGDNKFIENQFRFTDPNFFQIFDLKLIEGDSTNLLSTPNTIVIAKSAAEKYFGDKSALGQIINRSGIDYTITGICEDMPSATHFRFNFLASISTVDNILLQKADSAYLQNWKTDWLYLNCYTYIKLAPGVGITAFEEKVNNDKNNSLLLQLNSRLNNEISKDSVKLDFYLQPITEIHLNSHLKGELEANSKPVYTKLFIFIAIFILITTCVNFVNLTTAKARRRFREVAVRQLIGASRHQVAWQFITEAIIYCLGATFLGLVLLELFLPVFNHFFNLQLQFSLITGWIDFLWILALVLVVGILSGAYPAFFFAILSPKQVMEGRFQLKKSGLVLRGVIVCSQIIVSVFLLIVVSGMWWQINYTETRDPGFDTSNILVIERGDAIGDNYKEFKTQLLSMSGIKSVSACSSLPGDDYFQGSFKLRYGDNEKIIVLPINYVDDDYFTLLGLKLKTGRFLNEEWGDSMALVLNQEAITQYDIKKPLGHKFELFGNKEYQINIVGVVKDFNYESYYENIKPLALVLMGQKHHLDYILIKFNNQPTGKSITDINKVWTEITGNAPFSTQLFNERLSKLYDEDFRIAKILLIFSILAFFMTILSVIALTAFITEYKAKEIATKKILGSPRQTIILQIFSEFSIYVVAGAIMAIIPAYIALTAWIEGYAYYSFIKFYYFILAAILVAGLAYATVFYQSFRMASTTPIDEGH